MKKLLSGCLVFLFFLNPGFAQTAWIIGGQPANEGQFPWLGDMRMLAAMSVVLLLYILNGSL